ncbi:MAG: hypothetical protein U9R25_12850, partial [Chloroflexota bacterium]|nr:hypothetical protein [Chloroflexota bacterium]
MEDTPRLYDTSFQVLRQHGKWSDVRHAKVLGLDDCGIGPGWNSEFDGLDTLRAFVVQTLPAPSWSKPSLRSPRSSRPSFPSRFASFATLRAFVVQTLPSFPSLFAS